MGFSPLKAATLPGTRFSLTGWVRRRFGLLLVLSLAGATTYWLAVYGLPRFEETRNAGNVLIEPESLLVHDKVTLAPGIPKDRVPEYTIDKFDYVSTHGSEKSWNLLAARANLYNAEKLVHARQVTAYLFNPDGKPTIVTGLEARYFMNQRDLEVYGNVKTLFPDGFELDSDYLRYRPNDKFIEIPEQYLVHGHASSQKTSEPGPSTSPITHPMEATSRTPAAPAPSASQPAQKKGNGGLSFISHGLTYEMKRSLIMLRKDVKASVSQPNPTQIVSDHCVIDREHQIAHFTMDPSRPLSSRFVHLTQPTLYAKGRRAELNYGDFDKMLNYLILYEDTLVKEVGTESIRYGTGAQADFDSQRNVIILRGYPQLYQDQDTVTGDVIIMHRDTDIVEIEHSNGFSEGSSQ